jgi:excisionase family DNA binding protein
MSVRTGTSKRATSKRHRSSKASVPPPKPGALLTAEQAAELLTKKSRWLLAEARAGRFPCVRLGRSVRFRRESVERWIVEHEQGPVPGPGPGGLPHG